MSEPIKLSELVAARSAIDARIENIMLGPDGGSAEFAPTRTAIRATHNAADVLIEIARTALELSAAGSEFEHANRAGLGVDPKALRKLELAAIRAEEAHLAALTKVQL